MIRSVREAYNDYFSEERYQQFLRDIDALSPGAIEFRVAETPVFVDGIFAKKMISACDAIIDIITDPAFREFTERSIPHAERVAGETAISDMIAFDFGICYNSKGELEPQLIEMQGFPTLFGFQLALAVQYRKHFLIPENFSPFPGGISADQYLDLLRKVIIADADPQQVVLLEIAPHKQKTRIDFYQTHELLGIPIVCLTELIQEGRQLYYEKNGERIRIKRIYNRVIFDELNGRPDIRERSVDLTGDLDVEWVPHPNWFYRISKFTLPFIHHENVPASYFLNELTQLPADLENYVLKPLFSFAGQGVIIDLQADDLENISDPENWILQRKVNYAPVIQTKSAPAKAEIRLMYLWEQGKKRPQPAINLARLSKGKMIGVRYNKDFDWVGGSICFFEK